MIAAVIPAPPDFPDNPRKWDGWSKYRADNFYERLCLDPRTNPSDEQILQHCAALLQWWQNKLPLKNQPSNPMAQLLGRGLDDASGCLVQARLALLDPVRRRELDSELAARARQEAFDEFAKFVGFSIKGGTLTAEAEANLKEFGERNGLEEEQIRACINEELRRKAARRMVPAAPVPEPAVPAISSDEAEKEFNRILKLGALDMASATYSVRAFLAKVADSLGIIPERGERLLDHYLDQQELILGRAPARPVFVLPKVTKPVEAAPPPQPQDPPPPPAAPRKAPRSRLPAQFANPVGGNMVLLPAGEFVMGSEAIDAAPNEQPLTPVTLSEFYMSQFPVTNAEYEKFDPSHRRKRMEDAGDQHPVVYVTSIEASKYCEWLGQQDGKIYRLPTEAEWEYAARGHDGRKYPWGNHDRRSDLANFADASTSFPWREARINDGYAQTSPVGAFPRGASFFALEDMAGNVWEWCLDFYQPLAGTPKNNPRGPASGGKRVYRGGSWKSRFSNLRATARASNQANYACNDLGFRVVCDGERAEPA